MKSLLIAALVLGSLQTYASGKASGRAAGYNFMVRQDVDADACVKEVEKIANDKVDYIPRIKAGFIKLTKAELKKVSNLECLQFIEKDVHRHTNN